MRAQYVDAGLDKVKRTKVIVTPDARDDGRHFAYCRTDGGLIGLAPEMIGLPAATCLGIIAHEFGHAADYLYPGAFCVTSSGKVLGALAGPTSKQVVPNARYRHWLERNYDAVERTADKVAETVLGVRIGYAGPCMLETVNAGKRPRPKGLR